MSVALTGLGGLLGLGLHLGKRTMGRTFPIIAAAGIAAMLLQVVVGLALMNMEVIDPGDQHTFYGILIAFTMAFAYIYRSQFRRKPALYYGLLLLFLLGLGLRGIMTVGIDF